MDFFSGDLISALRGCCALKFLHGLKTDQALLAHTPRWDGVPPKNFDRENLKFGLKFSVLKSITSGLVAVSLRDFFQAMSREAGVITWVQFLQGPSPVICDGQKMSKIRRDFWQLLTLITNIFTKNQHIENPMSFWKSATPPTLDEKKVGVLWATNKKVIDLNIFAP